MPLSLDAVVAMRYVSEAPLSRIFAFTISDEMGRESFSRAAETYLLNHLERDFEALRFFKTAAVTDRTSPPMPTTKPEAASRDLYNEKQEKV